MSQTDSYTEEEAATKICVAYINNKCQGSACMAWRWSQADKTAAISRRAIEVAKAEEIDWGKAYMKVLKEEADQFKKTEGYCGLAGYPHNSLRP